jgi:hypothetical protein
MEAPFEPMKEAFLLEFHIYTAFLVVFISARREMHFMQCSAGRFG